MKNMVDSFWRALAYCFHPKVILLTLLPLLLMLIIVMGLGMVYWDAALESIRTWIDASSAMNWAWVWLERVGLMSLKDGQRRRGLGFGRWIRRCRLGSGEIRIKKLDSNFITYKLKR